MSFVLIQGRVGDCWQKQRTCHWRSWRELGHRGWDCRFTQEVMQMIDGMSFYTAADELDYMLLWRQSAATGGGVRPTGNRARAGANTLQHTALLRGGMVDHLWQSCEFKKSIEALSYTKNYPNFQVFQYIMIETFKSIILSVHHFLCHNQDRNEDHTVFSSNMWAG